MAGTKTLKVEITGDASRAKKAFDQLDQSASKSTASVAKAEKGFGSLGSTLKNVGGFLALGAALHTAVDESQESVKVGNQTTAVLKSTGGAANVTAAQVGNLASAMSLKTGIDDEAIQSGANVILTFKNIANEAGRGNDIFNQATQVALDMSVALGQDLKSSAILVGKALNDPIYGLTSLTRVGVTFDDQTKKQIKTLTEQGKTLEAQKLILKELQSEFGGSAQAQATSLDKAKVAVLNLAEAVGNGLMPAIDLGSKVLTHVVGLFNELPGPLQTVTSLAVLGGGVWLLWGDKIKEAVTGTIGFAQSLIGMPARLAAWATANIPVITTNDLVAESELAVGAAGAEAAVGVSALQVATGVGLVLAVGAAAAALFHFGGGEDAATRAGKELAEQMDGLSGAFADMFLNQKITEDFINNGKFREGLEKLGLSLGQFIDIVKNGGKPLDELNAKVKTQDRTLRDTQGIYRAVGSEAEKYSVAQEVHKQRTEAATQAEKEGGKVKKSNAAATDAQMQAEMGLNDQMSRGITFSDLVSKKLEDLKRKSEDAAQAQRDLTNAVTGYFNSALQGQQITDKLASDFQDLAEQNKQAASSGLQVQNVWTQQNDAARQYRSTMTDILTQGANVIGLYVQQGVKGMALKAVIDQQWASLYQQARAAGLSDMAIAGLKGRWDQFAQSPDIQKAIGVDTSQASSALAGLQAQWNQLKATIGNLGIHVSGGLGSLSGHASGGFLDEGLNLINEQGPELLRKTGSSVQVYTAGQTARMLAPAGASGQIVQIVLNVGGSVVTERDLVRSVRDGLLQMQHQSPTPILPGVS